MNWDLIDRSRIFAFAKQIGTMSKGPVLLAKRSVMKAKKSDLNDNRRKEIKENLV
jgi:hypothetical protein